MRAPRASRILPRVSKQSYNEPGKLEENRGFFARSRHDLREELRAFAFLRKLKCSVLPGQKNPGFAYEQAPGTSV